MSGEITILVQFGIAECKADELKEIFNKAVAIARSEEPGTLSFNQYFNEDNTVCYSLERYTGSEALVSHFKNATHNIQKLGDIAKVARVEVFGDISDELREIISPYKPTILQHYSGYN